MTDNIQSRPLTQLSGRRTKGVRFHLLPDTYELLSAEYMRLTGIKTLDAAAKENIKAVTAWMDDQSKPSLLIMGGVGNGKTTMITAMRNVLAKAIPDYVFDLFSADKYSKLYNTPKLRYDVVRWMAIDDMGTEPVRITQYGNEQANIEAAIMYRYNERMTTVLTTNLNLEMLRERYGERICDRIRDQYHVIIFKNPSYR